MFGFGKKKQQADIEKLIDVGLSLIHMQVSLGDPNQEKNEKLLDKYARGYIFGFCDSLLQSAGITNQEEALEPMILLHNNLYHEGDYILKQSIKDQFDPVFLKGRMIGGQEILGFFNDKKPPMALAGYLIEK